MRSKSRDIFSIAIDRFVFNEPAQVFERKNSIATKPSAKIFSINLDSFSIAIELEATKDLDPGR